jgi:hypothetical protein
MNNKNKLGFLLVAIGVCIMIFSALETIRVFTGTKNPIVIFEVKNEVASQDSVAKTKGIIDELPESLKNIIANTASGAQQATMFPIEQIYAVLNLGGFYLLMHFLLGFGYKIASLGISLLKN